MKYILPLIALLFLGQAGPNPQPVPPTAVLAWDAPTTNADGTPLTDLAGFVVAISAAAEDLNTGGVQLARVKVEDPVLLEQALTPLVEGLQPNTYQLWVLAYDESGNKSEWSQPLLLYLDRNVPGAPGGLRIKITVIVEVNQ